MNVMKISNWNEPTVSTSLPSTRNQGHIPITYFFSSLYFPCSFFYYLAPPIWKKNREIKKK